MHTTGEIINDERYRKTVQVWHKAKNIINSQMGNL